MLRYHIQHNMAIALLRPTQDCSGTQYTAIFQTSTKNKQTEYIETRRRPLDFDQIVAGMGDFSDLREHDASLIVGYPNP